VTKTENLDWEIEKILTGETVTAGNYDLKDGVT